MSAATALPPALVAAVKRHWGFTSLRPLQEQAIRAALAGRDSLVVLPTGGGKSLCYQAPAVVRGGLTVVVSPLIALMKDQVDGLTRIGVPAARLDSTISNDEFAATSEAIRSGETRLVFTSPERLINTGTYRLLRDAGAHTVAVDEAHCVSHWGHDFRPEYRQLARLREFFPNAAVHAYTATATDRVREDIAQHSGCGRPPFWSATSTARTSPSASSRGSTSGRRCAKSSTATAVPRASCTACGGRTWTR